MTEPPSVLSAIRDRHSTRAFTDQAVSNETIRSVLDTARWAPSGANRQPWSVVVATGTTLSALKEGLVAHVASGGPGSAHYLYYPTEWPEPYLTRRRANGYGLYQVMGIERSDLEGRMGAMMKNFEFFGAPVGLLIYVSRSLEKGAWVDTGMFVQSLMLAAHGRGLATCAQASIGEFAAVVEGVVEPPADHALVCGMSLGYADQDAVVNTFHTEREEVDTFTAWYD